MEAYPARPSFLAADPARVAHWRGLLAEAQGPKVGLLWKSAVKKDSRHRYFSAFEDWAPILAQPGVTFVKLQYGDCAEELAFVKDELGVEIWSPPGIDLKQELDDVAALSSAMDLIVGFGQRHAQYRRGLWRAQLADLDAGLLAAPGNRALPPGIPTTRVFIAPGFGDWKPVMSTGRRGPGRLRPGTLIVVPVEP